MKKVLVFILIVMILTACAKNESIKPVTYQEYKTLDGELVLALNNNDERNVDIEVNISYLDQNNNEIDFDYDYLECVSKNSTVYMMFDLPKEYANYKIEVTNKENIQAEPLFDKVDYTSELGKDKIKAFVKNKGKKIIDRINVGILYYKDEEIIGYDSTLITNLKGNGKKEVDLYLPYKDKNIIEYDKYEIVINEAFSS